MTAKEMFEKLGYEKTCHDEREIIYSIYSDNVFIAEIEFDLQNQTFYCACLDEALEVGMKTLKAINQQCRELGWLDE